MKRKVNLCQECVDGLKEHFPYLYPDGTPMEQEDLEVEVVSNKYDCDNYVDNMDRKPIWVEE